MKTGVLVASLLASASFLTGESFAVPQFGSTGRMSYELKTDRFTDVTSAKYTIESVFESRNTSKRCRLTRSISSQMRGCQFYVVQAKGANFPSVSLALRAKSLTGWDVMKFKSRETTPVIATFANGNVEKTRLKVELDTSVIEGSEVWESLYVDLDGLGDVAKLKTLRKLEVQFASNEYLWEPRPEWLVRALDLAPAPKGWEDRQPLWKPSKQQTLQEGES